MPDAPETIIPPASGASSPTAPSTIITAPGGGSSPTAPSAIVPPASAGTPPVAPQTVTPQGAGVPDPSVITVPDGGVTEPKLAAGSVTLAKLAAALQALLLDAATGGAPSVRAVKSGNNIDVLINALGGGNAFLHLTEDDENKGLKIGVNGASNDIELWMRDIGGDTLLLNIERANNRAYFKSLVRMVSGFRVVPDPGGDGSATAEIMSDAQDYAKLFLGEEIGSGRISGGAVRFNGDDNMLELVGVTQPTSSAASLIESVGMTLERSTGNVAFKKGVDFSDAIVTGLSVTGSGYNGGFALITDSHVFTHGNAERFASAMTELRSLGASCAIHLGDLVDDNFDGTDEPSDGYDGFFGRHISNAAMPWYQCYGNHDAISAAEAATAQMEIPDAYRVDHNDGSAHPGYYTFLKEGIHVIVLAATLETGDATGGYDISPTQLTWLQNTLDSITGSGKRLIVCCHVCPANEPGDTAPFGGISRRLVTTTASSVRGKLEAWQTAQGKVLCVLSGHDHIARRKTINSIDYLTINQVGTGTFDGRDSSYEDYPRFGISLLQWDEALSTLSITGYNGNTSYNIFK